MFIQDPYKDMLFQIEVFNDCFSQGNLVTNIKKTLPQKVCGAKKTYFSVWKLKKHITAK
jgi:hypothetical protein